MSDPVYQDPRLLNPQTSYRQGLLLWALFDLVAVKIIKATDEGIGLK